MFILKMCFFAFLNLIDLIYLLLYYELGESIEINPIAKIIIASFGPMGIITLKVMAVAFFIAVTTFYYQKDRRKAMNVIDFLVYIYFIPIIIIIYNIF